jgi:hypothetical protein
MKNTGGRETHPGVAGDVRVRTEPFLVFGKRFLTITRPDDQAMGALEESNLQMALGATTCTGEGFINE